MNAPYPDARQQRMVAYVIWAALLMGVLIFAGVVWFLLQAPTHQMIALPPTLDPAPAVLALAIVATSRIVPFLMKPGTPPLARHIVACALCEGAALTSLVFLLLTGHLYAGAGVALGLVGLLACFPGEGRWRALSGTAGGARGGESERSSGPGIDDPRPDRWR